MTNDFLDPGIRSADNWVVSGTGGTISRITDDGTENNDCLEVSGSTANGGARMANTAVRAFAAPLAERIVTFDAKSVSGNAAWNLSAFEFSEENTLLAPIAVVASFTLTGEWTTYTFTYTPTNASTSYVCFGFWRAASIAGTARFDQVVVARPTPSVGIILAPADRPITMLTPH